MTQRKHSDTLISEGIYHATRPAYLEKGESCGRLGETWRHEGDYGKVEEKRDSFPIGHDGEPLGTSQI